MRDVKYLVRCSALAITAALAGCSVGPDYQAPLVSMPTSFQPHALAKTSSVTNAGNADLTQWWRTLHDRELDSLIDRAHESNFDLAIALDRLQQARLAINIIVDQGLPTG